MAEAYRTIPLHRSQWPTAVVCTSDSEACIDTCTAFGATSSAGSYGHLADAAAHILHFQGIGPLDKWVDNHIFIQIPKDQINQYNAKCATWAREIGTLRKCKEGSQIWYCGHTLDNGTSEEFNESCTHPIQDLSSTSPQSQHDHLFTYAINDIDQISHELGIPWETSKDQPFSHLTIYIGFVWDLHKKTVTLSPEKAAKYTTAICEWKTRHTHCLEDVKRLYRKLLHTASLIPEGRAYLMGLEWMLSVCEKMPFMPHCPEKSISEDLDWWLTTITTGRASCCHIPYDRPSQLQQYSPLPTPVETNSGVFSPRTHFQTSRHVLGSPLVILHFSYLLLY